MHPPIRGDLADLRPMVRFMLNYKFGVDGSLRSISGSCFGCFPSHDPSSGHPR